MRHDLLIITTWTGRQEEKKRWNVGVAEDVVDEQIPVKFGKLIAGLDVMMCVIFVSF